MNNFRSITVPISIFLYFYVCLIIPLLIYVSSLQTINDNNFQESQQKTHKTSHSRDQLLFISDALLSHDDDEEEHEKMNDKDEKKMNMNICFIKIFVRRQQSFEV
jgi:hypothetical protein